ncbi:MAG TPA: extracellular solute-binding protein [Terriglobales bacterium]|nr:extracellular solute-binding protein [Terriglobales bacterium]
MTKIARSVILAVLLVVFVGIVSPVTAQESWWKTAAAPYAGITIHGVTESTPPSNYAANYLAAQFEAETGIKVALETTSWDQMYDKGIKDMQAGTGIYDFVYIEQDIIYSYLANHWLTDISQMMKDNPKLVAPDFSFDNFTTFLNYFKDAEVNDDVFGIPMEAFVKTYLYRLDLFNDPDIQAAYKAEYGKDLAPATTHEEYTQIADFFTKWGKDHGMDLWGTTVQATTSHPASFYEAVESVFPTFGVYNWGINTENWKSSVANGGELNSDKAKAALTWWINLLKDAPPESTSSTWDEVAATFAAGRAAQGFVYGENAVWIANDRTRSKVVGNVGVALPPLEPGVLDDAKAGKGYIGYFDGGAFGMPTTAKNKEATLLWLEYISQESVQADWAVAASRITLNATYDEPKVQQYDASTDHYFTKMKDDGYLFAGAPPFPFHAGIREVIAPFVWKAITGEMTVSDALDQAAAATDAELVKLGYGT